MSISYHLEELRIADDLGNSKRIQPPISSRHKYILDVGCGMGQTLIAGGLSPDVNAFGVDLDKEAILAGQQIVPRNVTLKVASGEKLPFPDDYFDMVYSRVTLPLMRIDPSLREMSRVLKPEGDLWLVLHSLSMNMRWLWEAVGSLSLMRVCGRAYVLANGILFNTLGRQVSIHGHQETFQTCGGIKRALRRAGFEGIVVAKGRHFIARAKMPTNLE